MTRQAIFGFGALFSATFLATILVLKPVGVPAPGASRNPSTAATEHGRASLPQAAMPDYVASEDAARAGSGTFPDDSTDFTAARTAAMTAPEAEARVQALQFLGDAPPTLALDVLETASSNGASSAERAMAIVSLRRLFSQQGDAGGRIRNALRTATFDADPIVVVLAQSALDEPDRDH